MSSSSSAIPQADSLRKSQPHSRTPSLAINPSTQDPNKSSNQPSSSPQQVPSRRPAHYTVFIRLPFPRNNFQDPPPVEWDAAKDKALWKLISKASNSKDLDWEEMSIRFEVSLPFLLQQAAWLYERHFEGMRAQMMKLGGGVSERASPTPGLQGQQIEDGGSGGVAMQRTGSKDSNKAPPAINTSKINALPPGETGSSPGTPRSAKPGMSRTPSANTVTQSRVFVASTKPPLQPTFRRSSGSQKHAPRPARPVDSSQDDDDLDELGHDRASESDSEEETSAAARSQALRRSGFNRRPKTATLGSDGDAEDDEDDSSGGGYLPFAATSKSPKDDPAATLRNSPKRQTVIPQAISTSSKGKVKERPPDSSTSSASSVQQPHPSSNDSVTETNSNKRGPISPRRRAELEKLSPRYRKSGSEGSPSMGSSFSDLDDASVTQSALEDALMSNVQHGSIGVGSRMSGLREALVRK